MIRRCLVFVVLAGVGFAGGFRAAQHGATVALRSSNMDVGSRRLPRVELHESTVGGTLRAVHDLTGLDVVATWQADKKALTHPDAPFDPDLSLHDITIWQLLERLNLAGDYTSPCLRYSLQNRLLTVEPLEGHGHDFGQDEEATKYETITCIYDVSSLVLNDGPWEKLIVTSDGTPTTKPANQTREDALQRLIINLIATDAWKDAGGSVGSLRIMEGQLIVTQTAPNQRAIYEVIKTLRAAK